MASALPSGWTAKSCVSEAGRNWQGGGGGNALDLGDGIAGEFESEALFAPLGALGADFVVKMGLDALQQMTKVKVLVFGEHAEGATHGVGEEIGVVGAEDKKQDFFGLVEGLAEAAQAVGRLFVEAVELFLVQAAGEETEEAGLDTAQGPDGRREVDVVGGVGGGVKGRADGLPLTDDEVVKLGLVGAVAVVRRVAVVVPVEGRKKTFAPLLGGQGGEGGGGGGRLGLRGPVRHGSWWWWVMASSVSSASSLTCAMVGEGGFRPGRGHEDE